MIIIMFILAIAGILGGALGLSFGLRWIENNHPTVYRWLVNLAAVLFLVGIFFQEAPLLFMVASFPIVYDLVWEKERNDEVETCPECGCKTK